MPPTGDTPPCIFSEQSLPPPEDGQVGLRPVNSLPSCQPFFSPQRHYPEPIPDTSPLSCTRAPLLALISPSSSSFCGHFPAMELTYFLPDGQALATAICLFSLDLRNIFGLLFNLGVIGLSHPPASENKPPFLLASSQTLTYSQSLVLQMCPWSACTLGRGDGTNQERDPASGQRKLSVSSKCPQAPGHTQNHTHPEVSQTGDLLLGRLSLGWVTMQHWEHHGIFEILDARSEAPQ